MNQRPKRQTNRPKTLNDTIDSQFLIYAIKPEKSPRKLNGNTENYVSKLRSPLRLKIQKVDLEKSNSTLDNRKSLISGTKRNAKNSSKIEASKKLINKNKLDGNIIVNKLNSKKDQVKINSKLEKVQKVIKSKIVKTKKISSEETLKKASVRLHSSAIPESLPCRESQFDDIYNFVTLKLINNEGGCMYVSGVPGTGKTATVHEVKRKIESNRKLPFFKFVEINGLRLEQPKRFCSHFLMELDGIKKSCRKATEVLNERFTNNNFKKNHVILFIDELDYLKTKKQEILYLIFDWSNQKNSKLIVLAIANSMDLPERIMLNRVSSRLGLTRLLFQPYNFRELEQIVKSRLSESIYHDVFESDALQLICRKVSAVTGDARRVLDVCRRSLEIAISKGSSRVSMNEVETALQETFYSIKINRIKLATLQEQIFFRSILQLFRSTGLEEFPLNDIYKVHLDICHFEGHFVPSTVDLSKIAINLHVSKLIFLEKSNSHIYRRVHLNLSPDDIGFALNLES